MSHIGSATEDNMPAESSAPSSGDAVDASNGALVADDDDRALPPNRFELELEFLQCLASPAYLHHLATTGMLNDPQFLAFLEYLKYWKRPEYVRFVTYPHCFAFLDLLTTNERFRREMANVGFRNFVHEQQFYSWQFRSRELYGTGLLNQDAVGPTNVEHGGEATKKGPDTQGGGQ